MIRAAFNQFRLLIDLLRFLRCAHTPHTIDSPEIYTLATSLKENISDRPSFRNIESLRKNYQHSYKIIAGDVGSQSKLLKPNRTVQSMAISAVSTQHKCIALYKIVDHFKPLSILELGTSLGISTLYLAASDYVRVVDSVEFHPELHHIAKTTSGQLNPKINFINDRFLDFISNADNHHKKYDFIYLDGDHSYEMTIKHFKALQRILSHHGVVVIDDIYWSKGMKMAWKQIQKDNESNFFIDLFYFGLVSKQIRFHTPINIKLSPFRVSWKIGMTR